MVIVSRLARGAAGLVGLGQEAYANRKNGQEETARGSESAVTAGSSKSDSTASNLASGANDRNELDQREMAKQRGHMATELKENAGPGGVRNGLPAPVVIPQRRPNTRSRGFLCAYAPALANCGIEEKPFSDFLDGFRTQIGGAFNALNIAIALGVVAVEATALGPSPALHFAALAVHLSVEAGKKAYVNKKTNDYLDKMNESMFKPCGLYAMIMTYDPSNDESSELVDFDSHTVQAVEQSTAKTTMRDRLQTSSAETLESQMPEICELIFPDGQDGDAEEQNRLKKSFAFAADYYDRRSQATYAENNPNSTLNVRKHEFAGRYADPRTFQNSSLIGVLTGGAIDPRSRRMERRAQRQAEQEATEEPNERNQRRRGLIGRARGMLEVGVLYLLIVNMPSEAELEYARKAAAHASGNGHG